MAKFDYHSQRVLLDRNANVLVELFPNGPRLTLSSLIDKYNEQMCTEQDPQPPVEQASEAQPMRGDALSPDTGASGKIVSSFVEVMGMFTHDMHVIKNDIEGPYTEDGYNYHAANILEIIEGRK